MAKNRPSDYLMILILISLVVFIIYYFSELLFIGSMLIFLYIFLSVELLIIFLFIRSFKGMKEEIQKMRTGLIVQEVKLILCCILIISASIGFYFVLDYYLYCMSGMLFF